jgi:hypothetical protein
VLLAACAPASTDPTEPAVLADAFFYARAYVDANRNGVLDANDTPLQGAYFNATANNGIDSGGRTDSRGVAMAWFPGGGVEYPVRLRMNPLPESELVLIGPFEIILQEGETASPDYLFSPEAVDAEQ